MRHRLANDYADVDFDILWETATVDLPAVVPEIENLLRALEAPGPPRDDGPDGQDEP